MKIAVPDLISNSYFPVLAADVLGFFKDEGLDLAFEHVFPVDKANEQMRDGKVEFVGGSAHSTLAAFPDWKGAKLICAQAQGMYWFLVMRKDLGIERGDLKACANRHIGAAPWVEMGLRAMFTEAGIDIKQNNITIAPIPGTVKPGVSFGVTAAKALADGKLDGFWANGMGAETAVRQGVGDVVIDARRGDGPKGAFNYTMPAVGTTERMIKEEPETVAAVVRAIVKTQNALKEDVSLATKVGEKLFPPDDAAMIADVVARDLPYYSAAISEEFVDGMNAFARDMGLLKGEVAFEDVVATEFKNEWS